MDQINYKERAEKLKAALMRLVGADDLGELKEMEAMARMMPAPAEDKAVVIDALHLLIQMETEDLLLKGQDQNA